MNHNIPNEFQDYMTTKAPLPLSEQEEKSEAMHLEEVAERSRLLRNLDYDKRETKKRIKQNVRWEFESTDLPAFYNQIDKIVDQIYGNSAQ